MTDATIWGVAGALFAVIAGVGLMIAAIALVRRAPMGDVADEFTVGYNLLAPQLR